MTKKWILNLPNTFFMRGLGVRLIIVFSQTTCITICWNVMMEFLPSDTRYKLPSSALMLLLLPTVYDSNRPVDASTTVSSATPCSHVTFCLTESVWCSCTNFCLFLLCRSWACLQLLFWKAAIADSKGRSRLTFPLDGWFFFFCCLRTVQMSYMVQNGNIQITCHRTSLNNHLCPEISPAPCWLVGHTQRWWWCHRPPPDSCSRTEWCLPKVAQDTWTTWLSANRWWAPPSLCLPSAEEGETGQGWMHHTHRCTGTGSPVEPQTNRF